LPKSRILIVDDEGGVRFGLRDFLEAKGFNVDEAANCLAAEAMFKSRRPDVAILDYSLPDGNALELMPRLKALDESVPLVILTGHGTIDLAVRAVKEGAEHFLTKPVELPTLLVMLERLLEGQRMRHRQIAGGRREARRSTDPFVLPSAAMRALAEEAERVGRSDSPVLILGETGVGKGVLARWLHERGPRAQEAFVDLNCASLSRELMETELFGHEKGAFTGAVTAKEGLLEVAHRGTMFLDEIGDVDAAVQPKLLKVLEEGRFRRLGDVRDREVDVRLIAATHQDLAVAVREKRFRSDLYFRISALPLLIPPLRERTEDIPVLARSLLGRIGFDVGRTDLSLSEEAVAALQAYPWPGNTRELRNVLERAVILGQGPDLGASDLRFSAPVEVAEASDDSGRTLEEVERRHIERVLADEGGHVERAARRLGVPRSSLYEKVKRLGIALRRD
jgi:DNA-binding NtrC family response regulator